MATRNLVQKSYGNLALYRMYKKEICGYNSNYLHMVPESSLALLPYGHILIALRTFETSLMCTRFNRHIVMSRLELLLGTGSNIGDVYDPEEESVVMNVLGLLKQYEGVKTLLSLLSAPDLGTKCCDKDNCKVSCTVWDIKACTLDTILKLTTLDNSIGEELCESSEVLQLLFSLMINASTCSRAAALVEHLLLLRRDPFQLDTVPGLNRLIAQLDGVRIANFCNVLVLTMASRPFHYEQSRLNSNEGLHKVRDMNQTFVLSIPQFLPRIVNFATKLPYGPRFEGLTVENDHWMQHLEDSISCVLNQHCPSSPNSLETPQANSQNLKPEELVTSMSHRVVTLSILGILLDGQQGKSVQAQLAQLRLIPRLSTLFDHYIWRFGGNQDHSREPEYVSSSRGSPEVSFKIELLRLLHNFCNQSEYRHQMLTPAEYDERCKLDNHPSRTLGQANPPLPRSQYQPEFMCCGPQGLLSKLVETLKRENAGSVFRYYICRTIESYLRSSDQFADQLFLLRRGLLDHLTASLLESDLVLTQRKELLPTFSLLGELLKFNIEAFRRLDHFVTAESKERFFHLVRSNLVDSHTFVRSLVVSYDHFTSAGGQPMEYAAVSPSLTYLSSFPQRLCFLVRFLQTVATLTERNVSCLSTMLVILMMGYRKSELPLYLQGLRSDADPHLLPNLRSLLHLWQKMYPQNKVKCNNTRIGFDLWRETVSVLLAENKSSPNCISYYLTQQDYELMK